MSKVFVKAFMFVWNRLAPILPDEIYLKVRFRQRVGYWPDLKHPKTFNEKLQWLKLHDKHPEYTKMVDKIEAKKYVASVIGEKNIIPTLGIWNSVDEIDWDSLPNQFVIKVTSDSGGIVVCKDKKKLDIDKAKKKLKKGWGKNYYKYNKEYPYKDLKPRIIAEQYMTNSGQELYDYKVHNFNGIPRIILLCRDRYSETGLKEDFYSCDWEHLNISRPDHGNALEVIARPNELDEMLHLSEKLAKGITFVRSDFYIIDNKVYFGELTFFPASGMKPFIPSEWDYKMGEMIKLRQ
jgi:hypothetical protein